MTSLNKTTLIGRVCADPQVRNTTDSRRVANFNLATNSHWKDKEGNKKESVEYHKIACFNEGLIGVIEKHIKKGALLYIEGSLQTRKWKDKEGIERYSTEIVLQGYNCTLTMLDKPKSDSQETGYKEEDRNQDIEGNSVPF